MLNNHVNDKFIYTNETNMMMHENQQAEILWATVMAKGLEKKERTVKGDWCNSAVNPPTVKLVFFLEHKDGKQ